MASRGFAELIGGVCGRSRNHGPSNVECVITKGTHGVFGDFFTRL